MQAFPGRLSDTLRAEPDRYEALQGTCLRHPIVRYALAVAAVGVAGLLRSLLGAQFPGLVPFATFFPAVLIATLLGSLGPGLLATVLSALWAWLFWLHPPAALALPTAAISVNLTLFVVVCLGLVATAEAARRYHHRSLSGERRFRAAEELAPDGFGILEAAREESEERFCLLADAVDDVFWITDLRQQKVVYVSPAYERFWGYSAELLYRDPRIWRQHVHPSDRPLVEQAFDEMLAGRRDTFELSYRMLAADGTVRWVRDKARLVRSGETARVAGIMIDVSTEKGSEEKQRLLSQELDHRLKNSFALVQSIARLSARSARDLGDFVDGLEARIEALARGQDVLVRGSWHTADLEEIVREVLALHAGPENRFRIEGPAVHVAAGTVPLFNMAFHELATNAAKYGALSVPGGRVSVRWHTQADEGGQLLLAWQESGGPLVGPPARRGFGSALIEQALAAEFGGAIEIGFAPEGVVCTMRLPLSERLTASRDAA